MIASVLLSAGSYVVTHGACGDVENAECYSFVKDKACLPLWEPGEGNCNRNTEVPAD